MSGTVEVGQVWRDNDYREHGLRTVTVLAVTRTHARVVSSPKGRHSTIRLDRFRNNGRGYTLLCATDTEGNDER